MLAKVLKENEPSGLMLLVDIDNEPATALYESMRFVRVHGQNNLTAMWRMP